MQDRGLQYILLNNNSVREDDAEDHPLSRDRQVRIETFGNTEQVIEEERRARDLSFASSTEHVR